MDAILDILLWPLQAFVVTVEWLWDLLFGWV